MISLSSCIRHRKKLRNHCTLEAIANETLLDTHTMHEYGNINIRTLSGRVKNKNYENDIERTLQYTRWFLTFIGVWPIITKCSSKLSSFFSILAIVTCLLFIAFTFVPAALHTIFREKNPFVKIMLLGPVGASLGSVLKYAFIILRANTIEMCIENMENDWKIVENEDERAIMMRNVTIGRGITVVCSLFLYSGGMSYHAMTPIFKSNKIDEFNATIRPLVYPGYDIFVNPQISPNYEIISILTCVSAFVRYIVTLGTINLAAIFVSHACGQVEIVMLRLAKLFDEIDHELSKDELQERISMITQVHVNGLRLSSKIDDGLREICLIEVMFSTLSICLLEYSCMKEWQNGNLVGFAIYSVLLTSYVFNIFIFCYIGELLQEQYRTVGDAAYMVEWYRLPGKGGLAFVMVMAMANYPRKLTAGRMLNLSIRNFGAIIRTSLTYLNMLRATTS